MLTPSDSESERPAKRQRTLLQLFLVSAKLSPKTIAELNSLANENFEICTSADEADVIVTAVHMRRRLERHVSWDIAKTKPIVSPDWLRNSVAQSTILPFADYTVLQTTTTHKELEDEKPVTSTKTHYTSRYACARPCPLVCPNEEVVRQLAVIRRARELDGKDTSALSYERAISVLKAYPYKLTASRLDEVSALPSIGPKMHAKIAEYISSNSIYESQTISNTPRFQSLELFTSVHGIGATTARKLFDIHGLRTLADVEAHYRPETETATGAGPPPLGIPAALALRGELVQRMSRAEVEAIRDCVMQELASVRPGCMSTIVGGYRRGKAESNDIDIVITHPELGHGGGGGGAKGLGELLVNRLHERGMVTHVMHLSGFRAPDALRTAQWDALEKALTVFVLPPAEHNTHRRLDLIFASPEAYCTAIVGWTGSKMFERDLRLHAREQGLKFDSSGITRRRDTKPYFPHSEREVFEILGLEWVEPEMRNADA